MTVDSSSAHTLIAIMGPELAPDAETRDFLVRLLTGTTVVETFLRSRRNALPVLLDPETIPAYALPALAASVGWSQRDPYIAELTDDQLRRLAAVAFRLWRERGTEASWVGLLGVLVGRFVLTRSWFDRRAYTGTWGCPDLVPGLGTEIPGAGPYSHPETVSDVWIEDPSDEVDLQLAAGLIERFRPGCERINVYRAWWVDSGRRGPGKWTTAGEIGQFSFDEAAGILTSTGTAFIARVGDESEDAWTNYVADLRLRITDGSAARIMVSLALDDLTGLAIDLDHGDQEVRLSSWAGEVETALTSVAWSIAADTWLRWRVTFEHVGASSRIRVYYEGYLVLEYVDGSGHASGAVGWRAVGGSVDAQGVLVFPVLPDRVRSGPTP